MKLKKIIAGHLLVLALVFPQAVFAAGEYTFNVGVNLVNLHPDVTAVKINCQALKNPDSGRVALGATEINVPASGTINKTVVVKANLFRTAGRNSVVANPGDAKHFICDLRLQGSQPLPAGDSSCNDSNNDWKCAKNNTLFVQKISGLISNSISDTSSGRGKPSSGVSVGSTGSSSSKGKGKPSSGVSVGSTGSSSGKGKKSTGGGLSLKATGK